jgi:UDP-N-acetylglucosamine 1-carboxyvinyltransferase
MAQQHIFIIHGQVPLQGEMEVDGNKNAALPLIAASVLFPHPVTLRRIPQILDVRNMCEILTHMGADVAVQPPDTLIINTADIDPTRIHERAWETVRAAILFVAPILRRFGRVTFPTPGGDVIGRRRLDTHFLVFQEMGATLEVANSHFALTAPAGGLRPAAIFLDEASVTATENALMAAALTPGLTVLENAACEPHVQDLTDFLSQCGAAIEGRGSNRLIVHGASELRCQTSFQAGADYIQTGAFIGMALCTNSALRIRRAGTRYLKPVQIGLRKYNARIEFDGDDVIVPADQDLRVVEDVQSRVAELYSHPWPGFPSDLSSTAVVLATQTEGAMLVHEKLFESRLFFIDKLVRMGARITLCDPHRALIIGKTELTGTTLESPDIRAGIALLTAALCANGETRISHAHQIDRGFFNIEAKLASVGARIERMVGPSV